ncbi:MAG: PorT family protein [Bacteroidales bacterium]|nr:PorT family protein [Bacteroidales bacterium]MBN2756422.1 PorT family protein [Bacteroidales bacterium]
MKKIIIIIIISLSTNVFAQREQPKNLQNFDNKWLHFGFTVGTNIMDFTIVNADNFFDETEVNYIYGIENQPSVGFHLGPVSNLRLGEYFDLRFLIDLSFGQRNLTYYFADTTSGTRELSSKTMKIASTFIEFPLHIKYKSVRINNFRPYLIAGLNPKLDLAARKKIKEEEMPKIRLKNMDLYYEFGFGIDFYLTYFKFSTEIKYGIGLFDIIEPDNTQFTSSIERMNSRMLMLSFHFE